MKRIKLCDRRLPDYTAGEEIVNMVTHIVGGALGVLVLVLCVTRAIARGTVLSVLGCALYGVSIVALYTVSSVYHGLRPGMAKKVLQVIDHCTIYFLIAGTYTPILLSAFVPTYPLIGWGAFGGRVGSDSSGGDSYCHRSEEIYHIFHDLLYWYGVGDHIVPAANPGADDRSGLFLTACRWHCLYHWRDLLRDRR